MNAYLVSLNQQIATYYLDGCNMDDLNDKVTGGTLSAAEWNQVPSELQNIIEDTDQTLSGADLDQLGKGVAKYVGNGDFYTDSGSANAYALNVVGGKQAPSSYVDGLRVRFIPGNAPTGASTINVASLGVKNLKNADGNALTNNYFLTTDIVEAAYNLAADEFRIDRPGQGEYIRLSDTKATTTDAGTFTSGAWQTRTLNTEDIDTGGVCTLASNQFTLSPGTYRIRASAPAYDCSTHQTRLRNITDSTTDSVGTSEYCDTTGSGYNRSFIVDEFTITASKTFELQHRCTVTRATNGLGLANSFGENEVYAIVELWKIK